MILTIEQMTGLLNRAFVLPHTKPSDVFLTAAQMAEAIENVKTTKTKPVYNGRSTGQRKHKGPNVTVKTLRDLGLDYPTAMDCAYDLVVTKGLSADAAAKRMASTPAKVRRLLLNAKRRRDKKSDAKARKESAERST